MPTRHDDTRINFQGMSRGDFQTLSYLGNAGTFFSAFSVSGSFQPLYTHNPGETTAATIARTLATLIMHLYGRNEDV